MRRGQTATKPREKSQILSVVRDAKVGYSWWTA